MGEGYLCVEDGDLDGFLDIELNCIEKICCKVRESIFFCFWCIYFFMIVVSFF